MVTSERVVGEWISTLPFEIPFDLENLESNISHRDEVPGEDEEVIGETTADERLVWNLVERFFEEARRSRLDVEFAKSETERDLAEDRYQMLKGKCDALKEIFWVMIRERTNLWCGNIGIRGDKIVKMPETLGGILGAIFSRHNHNDH